MDIQTIIGFVILVLIAIGSCLKASDQNGNWVVNAITNFVGAYVVIAVCCGVIWVVAWIGMMLRVAVMWLMVSVLSPLSLLFHSLF